MSQLIGFFIVIALIAGGLVSTGADAVIAALPFELALIGGAALGTLLIGNAPSVTREALKGMALAITGGRWRREDYAALLGLLHRLIVTQRRGGALALEADIETPSASPVFAKVPRLLADTDALAQLCDAFRLRAMGRADAGQLEEQLYRSIDQASARRMRAVGALQTVADALPALGIVAAVLGIIKTMAAIDQSNAVIGAMIATALLGTFLGVFLAYGLVGPLANRFEQVIEEELAAMEVIALALTADARGEPPRVAMETARMAIPPALQPSAADVDAALSPRMAGQTASVHPLDGGKRRKAA